jgi:hypothetical protein
MKVRFLCREGWRLVELLGPPSHSGCGGVGPGGAMAMWGLAGIGWEGGGEVL